MKKEAIPINMGRDRIVELMKSNPESTQMWTRRTSVPVRAILSDAGMLMQAAFEYFQWCENTPHYTTEWKTANRSLEKVKTPLARVFTMSGLALFMGMTETTITNFRAKSLPEWFKSGDEERKKMAEEFAFTFDWVESVIRTQKYEKAVVGIFKENLIARDLGLADKKIQENINWNAGGVSKEEAKRIAEDLEDQF